MSDLLPCPVCGGEDYWHTVGDVVHCDTGECTFACSEAHWNDWPRWVSVEERLPKVGWVKIPVIYMDAESDDNREWAMYQGGDNWRSEARHGSFKLDGVTHWLDGLRSIKDDE